MKDSVTHWITAIAAATAFLCSTAAKGQDESSSFPREWTLEQCLELSAQNDPYIKNSKLDILSARSRKNEAMWEYFPTVGLNGIGYYAMNPLLTITVNDILGNSDAAWNIRNTVVDAATEAGVDYEYNSFRKGYTAGVTATQPIFAGGRIINGNRLASIGVEAARIQSQMKERDTRQNVEVKYWQVVALQEKMKTLEAGKRLLDTLYRNVLAAREAGLALESDVNKVVLKRKELSSGEVTLKGGLKLAKIDLFNAIGVHCEFRMLDSVRFSGKIDKLTSPAENAANVSDRQSYESQLLGIGLEAKKLEKKMAEGEYLPEIGVGVTYGYGNIQGRHNGEKFNGLAFASVRIPLTGLGKLASRAKRYDNEVRKVQNEKEYLDSQLELRRQKMWLDLETAYEQARIAEFAYQEADRATGRIRADYSAGRATLAELLKAELDSRTAHEEFIDRCIDYRKALTAVNLF